MACIVSRGTRTENAAGGGVHRTKGTSKTAIIVGGVLCDAQAVGGMIVLVVQTLKQEVVSAVG